MLGCGVVSCGLSLSFNTTCTCPLNVRSLVEVYYPFTNITLIRKLFTACQELFWELIPLVALKTSVLCHISTHAPLCISSAYR